MEPKQSLIDEFMMVTGTTAEEAEKWLAVGGSNLDTAVDLFFSGGNVSANHHSSSNSSSYNNSNRNSYNNNRSYSSGQRQINDYPGRSISHTSGSHNSDMLNYLEDRLPNSTQPDASIAKKRSRRNNNRNLSDEESAGRNIGIEVDEDGIRRPDKVQRITLVSETGHYGAEIPEMLRASAFDSGSNFKPKNSKEKTLADLFQPPMDLMVHLPFDEAVELANERCQWLLINIQRNSEFSSHQLNRDVWGDSGIKEFIKSSFVFWQQLDVSAEGIKVMARYQLLTFPFIGIIDPRTGALVWSYKDNFDKDKLSTRLTDFIDSHNYPGSNREKDASLLLKSRIEARSIAATPFRQLTEEEELQQAIAASLHESCTKSVKQSEVFFVDSSDEEISDDDELADEVSIDVPKSVDTTQENWNSTDYSSGFVVKAFSNPTEILTDTSSSSNSSQESIQLKLAIKLPNGQKLTQSYDSNENIVNLIVLIATKLKESGTQQNQKFEVYYDFPRKSLCALPDIHTISFSSAKITSGMRFDVQIIE